MEATISRVSLRTGVGLRYIEQGPSTAEETLVFVHGWPDSAHSFRPVLAALPDRYRAVSMDLRGFGDSDRPASGYGMDDFATDVAAFIDALGLTGVTLIGHSMGSLVVRAVAAARPDLVRRLVLIGTGMRTDNAVLREVEEVVRDLPDPVPVDFTREFAASTVHIRIPEEFFDALVAESRKAPARVWRAALDGILAFDDAGTLAKIAAPTLVLAGTHDELFHYEEQAEVAAALPAARLTAYAETGHCPNWERPERVAADIDAFVRES